MRPKESVQNAAFLFLMRLRSMRMAARFINRSRTAMNEETAANAARLSPFATVLQMTDNPAGGQQFQF